MKKIFSFLFVALFSVSLWADDTWTVAGNNTTLFGTAWDTSNSDNDMAFVSGTTYQLIVEGTIESVNRTILFKVCKNHSFDEAYPTSDYVLDLPSRTADYRVTITFDSSNGNIGVEYEEINSETITLYFVNSSDWTTINAYAFNNDASVVYQGWPGKAMTPVNTQLVGKDVYAYTFPSWYPSIIFNNKVGSEGSQTADLDWDAETPYYYNGAWYSYASIKELDDIHNTRYFITGNTNLVGSEKEWHADAIRVISSDSYTFNGLETGKLYKLAVCLDGTWGNVKRFRNLTEYAAGLYADNDLNILFYMEEEGDVTVTYSNSEFKLEGNFALPNLTLKGNRLPEPSKAMTTNTVAQTASATFTLPDEYVGEGKYYSFLVAFSNLDQRCKNYTFNRDYDYTDNILSKGDSLSFRADFAGSYTITWNYATNGVTVVFAPIPDARYYVAGDLTDWNDTTQMARMVESEGVWSAGVTLNASSNYQFKIHRWQGPYQAIYGAHDAVNSMTSSNCTDWKLSSPGENINLATSNAGQYTFKFTPTDNNDLDVVYPNATAIDNTEVGEKAVKRIENGQLVIIKNGVKYNALGAEVK